MIFEGNRHVLKAIYQRRHGLFFGLVPFLFSGIASVAMWQVAAIGDFAIAAEPAAAATEKIEIVRKIPEYSRPIKIVSQMATADGKSASVTFEPTGGIFAVEIDLGDTKIERLTFVVKNVRTAEGVEFHPKTDKQTKDRPDDPPRAENVELKDATDVKVRFEKEDCIIEFGPAAIKILRRGGRFQFIDAYRV